MRLENLQLNSYRRMEWFILAYGALLRLTQYLSGRSLWVDESLLALNVVNRSFSQLLKPLDYNQGAPVGFLMTQRLFVQLFGPSEYALRLFPFLCGIASLFLFYHLAKKVLDRKAVPIALGLFAILLPLIYYSSEAKQYSSDVVVTLGLLSMAFGYRSGQLSTKQAALFGLFGGVSVWFSHPAVFVLAGIGVSMFLFWAVEKRWLDIAHLSMVVLLWIFSLAVCYLVSLRGLAANRDLLSYWNFSFPPGHPISVAGVEWFLTTFFEMFQNPVGIDLSGLAALAFVVGCVWMYWNKRKQTLAILIFPLLFTLAAAGLHKYPFNGRLLLFAVPALLLCVTQGAWQIWLKTSAQAPLIGVCFMGLLFLYPVLFSTYHLFKPNTREDIKPAMSYIHGHERAGDVIYVQYGAIPAFRYYLPRFKTPTVNVVQGNVWERYPTDVDRLAGLDRVWVLFAHMDINTGIDEETLLLEQLDKKGQRLDTFKSEGAAAFLYSFNQENARPEGSGQ